MGYIFPISLFVRKQIHLSGLSFFLYYISLWCIHTTAVKLNQFWHGLKFIYGLERVLCLLLLLPNHLPTTTTADAAAAALWLLYLLLFAVLFSNRKTFPQQLIHSFSFTLLFTMIKILLYNILRFVRCTLSSRLPHPRCQFVQFNVFLSLISIIWYTVFGQMSIVVYRMRFKMQRLQFDNLFEISWKT